MAKLGPDKTTIGCAGFTSCAITSDIRSIVPPSSPFVALTIVARAAIDGAACRMTLRHPCDGIAETTSSAPPSASASEWVTTTRSGSGTSGR